jgi:serine protease
MRLLNVCHELADLQGWGQCVATTGYGALHGLPQANDAYTASFNGTSSASSIVAAAAASLSSALEEAKGVPSTPQDVRARLIASGTPQDLISPGALPGEIGPQPDLRAALVTRPVSADLSITKSDSPDPATVGQALTYSLAVSNAGPDGASGVTVADTLPASVTFVSSTPSQGDLLPVVPASLSAISARSRAVQAPR